MNQSIENMKLINLKEGSLYSTIDYINALKSLINIPEVETYIESQVLIAPIDYPRQLHIWHNITHLLKSEDSSRIPKQILYIILIIRLLHIFLNSYEAVFLLNYDFFDLLFYAVFGHNKVLAKELKPYKINLI